MDSRVDVQAFRRDLFWILDTVASGGAEYQCGFAELCCMWFDDHWYQPEGHVREGILSEGEYQILCRFNEIFDKAHRTIKDLDLKDLQSDEGWLSVVKAARDAKIDLDALGKTKGK
jgi:hypothetical protein